MFPRCTLFDRNTSGTHTLQSIWLWLTLITGLRLTGADQTAADYFVHSLPGQPPGPLLKMHAGHIEVDPEHNGNLFFWHYQNRHIADRQRTVIWLNGGPGCSSMDGALMEIGPYRVREGGTLEYNEGSWDEFANLLFVDNPVGTGFSYVNTDSYVRELQEMADQFLVFLEKWFALFPEYEHDDIYLAGESYAGQHIPYIAQTILDRNAGKANDEHHWNLTGLLIGNGWISPLEQYQSYKRFALEEGILVAGSEQTRIVESHESSCLAELSKSGALDHVDVQVCENILSIILDETQLPNKQCYNMYDVRLTDKWPSCGMNWPPDLTTVTPYLRRADVVEAIHINPDKRSGWTECNGGVSSSFRAAHSKPTIQILPGIIEAGVSVLLFSGAKDLICNHFGTEDLISNMKWNGGTGFELSSGELAPRQDWIFEDELAGAYQEARNLTYVMFYNASHMVPFDWPKRTQYMLNQFIGVDVVGLDGKPTNSGSVSGQPQTDTSVEGPSNSTVDEAEQKDKLRQAELKAYYRSGEAALVVVFLAACFFGWWVWRGRRKERQQGYMSVPLANGDAHGFRDRPHSKTDVEAGDFDLNEMQEMQPKRGHRRTSRDMEADQYALGSDSEEDEGADRSNDQRDGQGKV